MRKRLLSIGLSVMMLFAMMPAAAFAGGGSGNVGVPEAVALDSVLGQTPEVKSSSIYSVSSDVTVYSISADVSVYSISADVSTVSVGAIQAANTNDITFYGTDDSFTNETAEEVSLPDGGSITVYAKVVSSDSSCEARYALTINARRLYTTTQQENSVIQVTATGEDRYYPEMNQDIVEQINTLNEPVITLLKDYRYTPYMVQMVNGDEKERRYVIITASLTLDLNGKTLTLENGYLRIQKDEESTVNSGTVTIKNGTVNMKNTSGDSMSYGIRIESGDLCTVEDCTFAAADNTDEKKPNTKKMYVKYPLAIASTKAVVDHVTATNKYNKKLSSGLKLESDFYTVDGGSFTGYYATYFNAGSTLGGEVNGITAETNNSTNGYAVYTQIGGFTLQGDSLLKGDVYYKDSSGSTLYPVTLLNVYISGDLTSSTGDAPFNTEKTIIQENVLIDGTTYTYYKALPTHTATVAVAGNSEGASASPSGTASVRETASSTYTVTLEEDYKLASATYQEVGAAATDILGDITWDGMTGSYTVASNPEKDYTITFTIAENFGDEVLASVGTTEYKSLSGAVNAMQPGDTLKLLTDTSRQTPLVFSQNGVLDLNGHTLTMNVADDVDTYAIEVSGAALTVKDTSEESKGKIDCALAGVTLNGTNAEFIMDSGAIYSKLKATCVKAQEDGQKITVNGGSLIAEGGYAIATPFKGAAQVVINGGRIENTDTDALNVIYLCDNSSLDMSGGSISGNSTVEYGVCVKKMGTVSISGGTLICKNNPVLCFYAVEAGTANLSGGTLTAENSSTILCHPAATSTHEIHISDGAKLDAADYDIKMDKDANINTGFSRAVISGGAFKYGEIPWSDSEYVSITDNSEGKARVLNIEADSAGDYVDWYRLVTTESLDWTDKTGASKTYQDFEDLNALITAASETYGDGTNTGGFSTDLWDTFEDAYKMAVKVSGYELDGDTVSNENSVKSANQIEIDYRGTVLTAALSALEEGMTQEEFDNLPDGNYSIELNMLRVDLKGLSMSDEAVDDTAVLTLKDGVGTLTMKFHPLLYARLTGHLEKFWVFKGDTPEEAAANAANITNYEEAAYSDLYYDTMNSSDGLSPEDYAALYAEGHTEYEPYLPGTVTFTLPYLLTTGNGNHIYGRVLVDAMNEIEGVGLQNVIVHLKYSTLESLETEDTLSLSTENVSLIAGSATAGSQTVTATVKSAGSTDYILDWSSDATDVATVENGVITAVGAGTCTVTATASKAGKDDLMKTVTVTVGAGTAKPVMVESVTTGSGTATVNLSGDTLVTAGQDANKVDVGSSDITVDASSGENDITTATVQMPAGVVDALGASGRSVTIQTDMGNVTYNTAALAQIQTAGQAVTLNVSEADLPASGLGEFTKAYSLTLTDTGGTGIPFADGTATVSVPNDNTNIKYAYYIQDGKLKERQSVSQYNGVAAWSTSHFSTWALSEKEYDPEDDGSSGGDGGGDGGGNKDEFFLADGNYYVDIDLWKATSDEASMGNVGFKNNDEALVTVSGGKVTTVQVATNPVDVDQYHSAIISFKVEGKSANVLKTGSLTTEPAGNKYDYIKVASFTMPKSGQPTVKNEVTYIDVQFNVPDTPMDAVVGTDLDARLKFTWKSADATNDTSLTADSSAAKGKSSLTGDDIEDVKLTDKATGIKLTTDTQRIDDDAVLSVTQITSGSEFTAAEKAMKGITDTWNLYKVIVTVNGKETAPEGSVTLYFPSDSAGLTVYRISDSGTKTVLKGEVKKGYYVLNTSSLGLFAIVGELAEPPAETTANFTDVLESYWASAYIAAAVEKGLFTGVTDTTFDPEGQMTRAMLFTVLHRMSGKAGETTGELWYSAAMEWSRSEGISDGTNPNRDITREELIAMLYRYAGSSGVTGDLTAFGDADSVSEWAADAMNWAVKQGILTGNSAGLLDPDGPATRAQVAAMLMRYLEKE